MILPCHQTLLSKRYSHIPNPQSHPTGHHPCPCTQEGLNGIDQELLNGGVDSYSDTYMVASVLKGSSLKCLPLYDRGARSTLAGVRRRVTGHEGRLRTRIERSGGETAVWETDQAQSWPASPE